MLTERDLSVLLKLTRYYVMSRAQLQRECFPTDNTGRSTRRRLQHLVSQGLIQRHKATVIYPNSSPAGSIYYPAAKGCELLAEHTGDDRHLTTPHRCPEPHHVMHWLAVTETHLQLDRSIAAQQHVELLEFVNEWDVVNKEESDPAKRFRLYTILAENPRLICAPDAAFVLKSDGYSKVFFLEQDRGTSGARQVAARKSKGYAAFAERRWHQRMFPVSNLDHFTVLAIAPNDRRRDALRRAFAGSPGESSWRFVSWQEVESGSFLHDPICYPVTGDPVPLVKSHTPVPSSVA